MTFSGPCGGNGDSGCLRGHGVSRIVALPRRLLLPCLLLIAGLLPVVIASRGRGATRPVSLAAAWHFRGRSHAPPSWERPEDRAVSADVSVPFCSRARLGRSSSDSLLPKPKPSISPPSRWIFLPVPSGRQRLYLFICGLGVQVLPGNMADPRERCATERRLDSARICVHSHTSRLFPGVGGGRVCARLLTRVVFTGSAV